MTTLVLSRYASQSSIKPPAASNPQLSNQPQFHQFQSPTINTLQEVGSAVTKPFKKGDRIAGFAHGGNTVYHEDGAFSNYITAKGDIQVKIPDDLSFEEAATLGVGVLTVGQALYHSMKLPFPGDVKGDEKEKLPVLIYGGSTATGSLAIQFAKLSGATVVTTCS